MNILSKLAEIQCATNFKVSRKSWPQESIALRNSLAKCAPQLTGKVIKKGQLVDWGNGGSAV